MLTFKIFPPVSLSDINFGQLSLSTFYALKQSTKIPFAQNSLKNIFQTTIIPKYHLDLESSYKSTVTKNILCLSTNRD